MKNFIALDFNTANAKRTSACAIGMTFVENGEIVRTEHYYIKPIPNYYDYFNTSIHGIKSIDTNDKPTFIELWNSTLKDKLAGQLIVCHNAAFEMSVLRGLMGKLDIHTEDINYLCTLILSKAHISGLCNYKLQTVSQHLGYNTFKHDDVATNAKATAYIFIEICKQLNCNNYSQLSNYINIRNGVIHNYENYSPCLREDIQAKGELNIFNSSSKDKYDNMFYNKKVLLIGRFEYMIQIEAIQAIESIGGIIAKALTSDVDYVIKGSNASKIIINNAVKLASSGSGIEILTEEDLISAIRGDYPEFTITSELIESGSKGLLERNMVNEFANNRVLFSSDISNSINWQLIGDLGGRCYWNNDELSEVTHFVVSNIDLQLLRDDIKSNTILLFEDGMRKYKESLSKTIVISEDCFFEYIKRRKNACEKSIKMNIIPASPKESIYESGLIIPNQN